MQIVREETRMEGETMTTQYIDEIHTNSLIRYGMGDSIAEIARDYNVPYGTVWTWITKAKKDGYYDRRSIR